MNKVGYFIAKLMQKIKRSPEPISRFYRRMGVAVGKDCIICGYYKIGEPELVLC